MNRRFFILFTLFFIAYNSFSQKVESDNIENGVRRIQSKDETIEFENYFRFNLEKFIYNGESQYFIRGRSEENEYHNFPNKCKLLFKTFDGTVIELASTFSELVQINSGVWEPTAYYPISNEQLQTLFNGISKIRVEMLSYNKKEDTPFMDYPELEFKKDKMGKKFKEMYDNVEKKELTQPKIKKTKKVEKGTSLKRKIASSDF